MVESAAEHASTVSAGPPERVAVVGGGIAGLAAALELRRQLPNAQVHLYECGDDWGGLLRTTRRDGFLVEHGADSFLADASTPWMLQLCQRYGLADDLLETDRRYRRALVARSGRLHGVPAGFRLMLPTRLAPLLGTSLLSAGGRLRLCAEWAVPAAPRDKDESLADFACRRFGREAYEWLIEPLVAGIYASDATRLSVQAALPQFAQWERQFGSLTRAAWAMRRKQRGGSSDSGARYESFVAPAQGMSDLIKRLAEQIPPDHRHLNTTVTGIVRIGEASSDQSSEPRDGWTLRMESSSGRPTVQQQRFDGIVLALPAHAIGQLIAPVDRQLAVELSSIEHVSSAVVCLGYDQSQVAHPLDAFGLVVPRAEGRAALAISFTSRKFSGRAPEGRVLLRVFLGGAGRDEVLGLDDERLIDIAQRECADLLGAGQACLALLQRWSNSMPQYTIGHLDRLRRIDERASQLPRLEIASNALRGVGLPQCVRGAEQAAARLAASLREPSHADQAR